MLRTKTSGFTESWRRLDMKFINSCTKCLLIQWFNIWLYILKYFFIIISVEWTTLMNLILFHIFKYKTFALHDTSNIESDLKKKRTRPKNIYTCLFMEIYKTISIWFPLTLPWHYFTILSVLYVRDLTEFCCCRMQLQVY